MNYNYGYNPAAAAASLYTAAAAFPQYQAVQQQHQRGFQPQPPQQTQTLHYPTQGAATPGHNFTNRSNTAGTFAAMASGSYSAVRDGGHQSNAPTQQVIKQNYNSNFVPAESKPTAGTTAAYFPATAKTTSGYSANNDHNERFEKAVINAAISVAQQREGVSSVRPGGGAGGGNFRAQGRSQSGWNHNKKPGGGDNKMYYCDVCKISCGGMQTYQTHIDGKQHKKKAAQSLAGGSLVTSSLKPGQTAFHCELCDITCTSQDAFVAHTSGAKHQKVAKLYEKLGKPVPTVVSARQAQVKIVSASGAHFQSGGFIGGSVSGTSSSSGAGSGVKAGPGGSSATVAVPLSSLTSSSTAATDSDEEGNEMIGAEYVETLQLADGKVLQYNCKLCDCKFNDVNARDMHLKGRRHRLSYKKKVNPQLRVDMKSVNKNKRPEQSRMRQGQGHWSGNDSVWAMKEEMKKMENELYARFGGGSGGKKAESFDDRHILAKHQTIYPEEETLNAVQDIVVKTEKALKMVSDKILEEDKAKAAEEEATREIKVEPVSSEQAIEDSANKKEKSEGKPSDEDDASKYRELKGVMRIGVLAKGLLLKGDRKVSLAVLCQSYPTTILLSRIFKLLPDILKELSSESEDSSESKFESFLKMEEGIIVVQSKSEPIITLNVYLTSPVCRVDPDKGEESLQKPPANSQQALEERSKLSSSQCLAVLAELRHQKWFEARASGLASCVIIVRIIYDLINRVSSWNPLPKWAAELLVEKALSCSAQSFMSPGDALRRVIETMASGVLLPGGCGLMDPCEREKCDAAASLTAQQREDITASAQHALRLITFKNIHKVLGIQPLANSNPAADRKRPAPAGSNPQNGAAAMGAKVTKL